MKSNVTDGGAKMKRPSMVIFFMIIFLLWETPDVRAQFSEAGVQKLEIPITAPDFTLKALGRGKISLKELRGKIVVLNFFSSWCPVCKEEYLSFDHLCEGFKGKEVAFLKVAVKGNEKELMKLKNESNITSPILIDPKGSIARAYGVGHHETFFINREGKIVGRTFSQKDWASESMKNLIRHLLVENK
jgi:peroxiredoxin